MKKCPSCGSELFPQARFCNTCGVQQPFETSAPLIPPPPPPTPPPPPPERSEEEEEDEDENLAMPLPEFWEEKPDNIRSTGRSGQQLHSDHLQSQQLHGDHLQPEETHGLHRQPEETHSLHQQPHGNHLQLEEIHGLHQQYGEVHNLHQQYEETYSPHQRPEGSHGLHQQPEKVHKHHQRPEESHGLHQQSEETHSLYTRTGAKVGKTAGKVGSSIGQQWVVVAVVAAVVLGASGVLAFHLFPHQPGISVGSPYSAQGMPVGADGTTLHIHGQGFAANSPITFQLDSASLNIQPTQSDGNGNLTTDLAVTSAWSVGRHTSTAHDTSNNAAKGIEIEVVQPGQSNTPGPNGAPADDASFTIQLNIQGTTFANDPFLPNPYTLIVTGHPDPEGGTVCASRDDGTSSPGQGEVNMPYTQTATYSCSGTYKGGQVSYSETVQTQTLNFSSGETCNLSSPQPILQITGSYTNEHNFSGNVTELAIDSSMYSCNPAGSSAWNYSDSGTWTSTVSQSHGSNCTPQITSVSSFAAEQNPTVNITGSCFGTNNTFSNTDSQYFKITVNASTSAEWHTCYTEDAPADSVTCTVSSWTDTSITFSGFYGEYGSSGWVVNQGDHLTIQIWNPQTNQGPGVCTVIAGAGSTSQCS